MPIISFVVPVYKMEKYIHQCVDSILNQSFHDFELILVDDGSPDRCPQICDEYAAADQRIKVIHKVNAGVSEARNSGIDAATGEWVYFVDSDDWIEPNAAEILYHDAIDHNADCVMSDCVKCYDDGTSVRLYQFSQVFETADRNVIQAVQKNMLCHRFSPYYSPNVTNGYAAPWGKFVKLSILKQNNIRFDPRAKGVFDDGIYSLYLLDHVNRFYYNRKHTYNYRIVGNSITHAFKPNAMEITELNYKLVDEYIEKTHKDKSFLQAECCRRVACFASFLSKFYFNPQNSMKRKDINKRMYSDLKKWPYDEAFGCANYKNLEWKHRYVLFSGKHKFLYLLRIYALLRQAAKVKD